MGGREVRNTQESAVTKKAYHSKTIWFALVVFGLSSLNYLERFVTDPEALSILGSITGVMILALRFLTRQEIG